MNKKKNLQLLLFLFLLILAFIFFKMYNSNNKNNVSLDNQINSEGGSEPQEKSNILYKIEYTSLDKEGNNYNIKSELGEIENNNSNVIFMEIVEATVTLKERETIKIYANNAVYNSQTLDTNFFDNVIITYAENKINADNVDLFFQKSLLNISNNVFYKNLNTNLMADKVHMDLKTNDIKIFMQNKNQNVKIKNIN